MNVNKKTPGNRLTLVLPQDRMGRGDDALGAVLIRKFLKTFSDIAPAPDYVLLYNTGVKLACEGSEALSELKALEARGASVLNCGTCLDHFDLRAKLRVGAVSNMHEITAAMTSAQRCVQV